MSAFAQRLRGLFQRGGIGRYGHVPNVQGPPFYEARAPWWARFTWGFIAADLLVTSTMTELTWTKWTYPPEKPGAAPVQRPAWQRAGLCLGHLSIGVGLGVLLVVARSRVVRILHILPPSPGTPRQLLIVGAHRHGTRGAVVPFARTHIDPGRDETEAILRVQDVRGHWWIGLNRARLRGTAGASCTDAGRVRGRVGDAEGRTERLWRWWWTLEERARARQLMTPVAPRSAVDTQNVPASPQLGNAHGYCPT
ncbi:hypothetical protein BC834DRAFT_1044121 [Gloeopeniophorella convolvens]|nr:hypothetical protein BC834DRAFT_1044121 [Gloeopeniophorella convolvens]